MDSVNLLHVGFDRVPNPQLSLHFAPRQRSCLTEQRLVDPSVPFVVKSKDGRLVECMQFYKNVNVRGRSLLSEVSVTLYFVVLL